MTCPSRWSWCTCVVKVCACFCRGSVLGTEFPFHVSSHEYSNVGLMTAARIAAAASNVFADVALMWTRTEVFGGTETSRSGGGGHSVSKLILQTEFSNSTRHALRELSADHRHLITHDVHCASRSQSLRPKKGSCVLCFRPSNQHH